MREMMSMSLTILVTRWMMVKLKSLKRLMKIILNKKEIVNHTSIKKSISIMVKSTKLYTIATGIAIDFINHV